MRKYWKFFSAEYVADRNVHSTLEQLVVKLAICYSFLP